MKILHVITGLNDGGAEAVLTRLCIKDRENSHVVVSILGGGKYGELLRREGIPVYMLMLGRGRNLWGSIFFLYKIIRSNKPDVVQTWMYHADLLGGVVARLALVKKVFWGVRHSNFDADAVKRTTKFLAKILARLSYVLPTKIISCSYVAVSSHVALGYRKKAFSVVQNGYDLSQFDDGPSVFVEEFHHLNDGRLLFGTVARFHPQKDHRNLLHALSLFKRRSERDFIIFLVGAGLESNNLALVSLVEEFKLQDNVVLLGKRGDVPNVMRALDLHILPSLGEAFPNVLAEAMACGVPCVTTDAGDARFIVDDCGWVVPVRDANALAIAIEHAVLEKENDSIRWNDRKLRCRKRIEKNYSIQSMIDGFCQVWRE